MTAQRINELIRKHEMSQTTPAVKSKSLWGSLLGALGLIEEATQIVGNSGVVPPHTGLVLVLIGQLLNVFGRLNPDIKPIEGLVGK